MSTKTVKIGTRGSPLALAQAHETRERLAAASGRPAADFEIVVIRTSGDAILDRPLSEVGGKGLFTKEIETALIEGTIDLAVHSSKDMPTILPDGLAISAFLPREDVRDAFVSPRWGSLAEMPAGARVGTSSLRRRAQVKRLRPDLEVVEFRGNVQTRLKKLADGVADATLLALAGLKRLGREDVVTAPIAVETFLPAVGQGAICVETRIGDTETDRLVGLVHHAATAVALVTERAFLRELDGSCRTPIAGLARVVGETVAFDGLILTPDGSEAHAISTAGPIAAAESLGREAGRTLKTRGGPDFFVTGA